MGICGFAVFRAHDITPPHSPTPQQACKRFSGVESLAFSLRPTLSALYQLGPLVDYSNTCPCQQCAPLCSLRRFLLSLPFSHSLRLLLLPMMHHLKRWAMISSPESARNSPLKPKTSPSKVSLRVQEASHRRPDLEPRL
jgi:hypothetical protein